MRSSWFRRTIYSETKKASEQELVAWVIRNRVESGAYGGDSYEDVVLARGQFSGMHATDERIPTNISMSYQDSSPSWDSAVSIARSVYYADADLNPLSSDVMHFYSPISVMNTPSWAVGLEPAHTSSRPCHQPYPICVLRTQLILLRSSFGGQVKMPCTEMCGVFCLPQSHLHHATLCV